MCNINILIKKEQNAELLTAYMSACAYSYATNSDANGFYFSNKNKLIRHTEYINLLKREDAFIKSNVIIGHQRISTSGFNFKSTQPFKQNGFVFVHNGILSDYDHNKDTSDSQQYFQRFLKCYKQDKDIIKAIQDVFNDASGSFSIFLYNISSHTGYYFKSSSTNIEFYLNPHFLYITTNSKNSVFFKQKLQPIKIENFKIYKITQDLQVIEDGILKPITYKTAWTYADDYPRYTYKKKKTKTLTDEEYLQQQADYMAGLEDYDENGATKQKTIREADYV